ncbi:hypothetical protein DSO57_1012159 [Entomophthora muscae]|uniref:Uncharacterized protein n=1 Tax=Entomophthora muscae TaxID=34485 RepID=A0ACC2SV55_9FUNG|nr:hypothetical protein DSO57_1012159 [Entomophthora muscae]
MHPVIGLLQYILYNLILNQIISGRWGPATGTLLLVPPNVNFMPSNFAAPPPILETENCVNSQCPEFYAEYALMLSQVIYLGLLWLGLIFLLNPGVTIRNFAKKYLKLRWWLTINSMWIWVRQSPSSGIDSQTSVDKTKAFDYYRPPNAPFGPVHFTEYPLNPDHKPWTLEDLQWYTCSNAPKEPYQIVCDSR